jgi:hypothetical protein
MTANAITTETPVSYIYSNHITKYGIVIEMQGDRAKIQWQAQYSNGSSATLTTRINQKTTVAIKRLSEWTEKLRLDDGITLCPSGLEYRTPK